MGDCKAELEYKAIALDLDGVVADTRDLHFDAWKRILDKFLKDKPEQRCFSEEDYSVYVDGVPRKEGISQFLESRKIKPEEETVNRLGDDKNKLYQELLEESGAEIFDDSVRAIKRWKKKGILLAIVSSSKNARLVLEKAQIEDLFDARVDGVVGERRGLKGKPSGEYFVEALKELGVDPSQAAIVEDAESGVRAGKDGGFKRVFGMDRSEKRSHTKALKDQGADQVVCSLLEIQIERVQERNNPPFHALKNFEEMKERIGCREIALFLDFDGTLAPILPNPDDVELPSSLKEKLEESSKYFKTAIMSGRDRRDVKERVGLPNLFYGGSHGFDITGPGGFRFELEEAHEIFPALDRAQKRLESSLHSLEGIRIERKRYAIAVHYRQASAEAAEQACAEVRRVGRDFDQLKVAGGKKIYELKPNIDWGKGKAIEKLCQVLEIDSSNAVAFYLGDDVTDEDGFEYIKDWGVGIRVGDPKEKTKANYWLEFGEVENFIELLNQAFGGGMKKWRRSA